ncbi:hypothetical protein KUTeg_017469 [Tegillarca granosa]|uniref:SHSP domain-containing protein n=1 Tax=Tegillarca granosa TaxID=220873 RepID=A0ABQ9EHI8_TEGGR|nr:hypothetical protein KUTeg_017469 [Tegillarca granosa]
MHQLHPFDMQAVQPGPLQLESPFVEDADGNRKLSLTITVRSSIQRTLKEVKETPMKREFTRTYNLPNGVDHRQVVSHLTSDGVLHIEAPAPPNVYTRKEILIPIQRLKQH